MKHGYLLEALFEHLALQPYHWQRETYQRFLENDLPSHIQAPTAAGKTMILAIYLAALATQAGTGRITLPRRLVYVVNRRVLVDEATRHCEHLRRIVLQESIPELTTHLRTCSSSRNPLAISTLRGECADNGEWFADPSTPALILATPDMLGSRLLFRGYGLGRNRAPLQAGLLGIDTLVIHDEAHLAPAFSHLLRQIEQRAAPDAAQLTRPPLHLLEMTATLPPTHPAARILICDPQRDPALQQRMRAAKRLQIQTVANASERQKAIVAEVKARADCHQAIAIFVTAPDDAAKLQSALTKVLPPDQIAVLTGTMRGTERAELLEKPAWKRLRADRDIAEDQAPTAVLIATSAGEIGIDLDADVLLCDDATLDRQIQRIGRCNRRGRIHGEVWIYSLADGGKISAAQDDLRQRQCLAGQLLQQLPVVAPHGHDASPAALSTLCNHPDYADAIEPAPSTRDLEDNILALYAATSVPLAQLHAPAPDIFIHGLQAADAEIHLLWRHLPPAASIERWLAVWPLHRDEMVRLPLRPSTHRLLNALCARASAVVLNATGSVVTHIAAGDECDGVSAGGYVLFDCAAGGLTEAGLPQATALSAVTDVSARQFSGGCVVSCRVQWDADDDCWRGQHAADQPAQTAATLPDLIEALYPDLACIWYDHDAGRQQLRLWLRLPGAAASDLDESITPVARLLTEHLDLTARAARGIAAALALPSEQSTINIRAGHIHDQGKEWAQWQAAIGNPHPDQPLGKSGHRHFDSHRNAGYRHELGSLVDCPDSHGLVRQLVAAHHGHARPTVPAAALLHRGCAEAAHSAALGYAHYSRQYGHWGLAYLEALLKCADVLAETRADELARQAPLSSQPLLRAPHPPSPQNVDLPSLFHAERVDLPINAGNPGEYWAALGLCWLVHRDAPDLALSWHDQGATLQGIGEDQALQALHALARSTVTVDTRLANRMGDGKYPPLRLQMGSADCLIAPWCNERFTDKSAWKLAAGRSSALQTLKNLLGQCAAGLSRLHTVSALTCLAVTKTQGGGEAQRFRYDAAASWTALDVGWSPYEEGMGFSRPWIEVLAVLGIQALFPAPASPHSVYHTWSPALPFPLLPFAARGLFGSLATYQPTLQPSGKNWDVYPATTLTPQGATLCPHLLMI